jgi:outer membrane protein assembly factor BamB
MSIRVLAALVVIVFPAGAQDWTQWRGPNRDGVAAFTAPAKWPEKLTLVWKAPMPSGYATPVVLKDRAWVHGRDGEEEVVSSFDLTTGKQLWSKRYSAAFTKNQYAVKMGKGPNSTPLVHQGRLFTLGTTAILSSFDAATGELMWRKELGAPNTSKMFCGTAASPMMEGGNLIIYAGDDINGGRLYAFDPATGAERWKWTGDGPGYGSPIVMVLGGMRHIVTFTDKSVVGVDARDGKLLWKMPFPDEWNENIVTPVVHKDLLILSGVRKGTSAVRVALEGGAWTVREVWKNPDVRMYMSSPVLEGKYLYGMSERNKGQFFCLDADTGKVQWLTTGREGANAALLNTRDALLILTADGSLIAARKSPQAWEQAAKYSVAESSTYSHPVAVGNRILIRDESSIALWRAN